MRNGGSGAVQINANNLQMSGGDIGVINLSTLPPGDVTVTLSGTLSLRNVPFSEAPFTRHQTDRPLLPVWPSKPRMFSSQRVVLFQPKQSALERADLSIFLRTLFN